MIIENLTIGTGKKRRTVYIIASKPTENGSDRPKEISRHDTLAEAALVMRYMTGAEMTNDDMAAAMEAIKKADAQTCQDQSTR